MKLPLINGEVDTDKLNDKDAAIYESIINFYDVCKKYNVTGFAKLILQEENGLSMLHIPDENDEVRAREYTKLITYLSEWINKTSGGRLIVIDTQKDSESQESDDEKNT
jgi:hypothetical protein